MNKHWKLLCVFISCDVIKRGNALMRNISMEGKMNNSIFIFECYLGEKINETTTFAGISGDKKQTTTFGSCFREGNCHHRNKLITRLRVETRTKMKVEMELANSNINALLQQFHFIKCFYNKNDSNMTRNEILRVLNESREDVNEDGEVEMLNIIPIILPGTVVLLLLFGLGFIFYKKRQRGQHFDLHFRRNTSDGDCPESVFIRGMIDALDD